MQHEPLRIDGRRNFLFLGGVVATILAAGHGLGSAGGSWPFGVQEALLLGIAVAAYRATPHAYRAANAFAFGPIIEVAVLFAGIFVTMAPALLLLNANAARASALAQPWQFFWASGLLSSFLDNAPTYLTFAATACGVEGIAARGQLPGGAARARPRGGPDPRRDFVRLRVDGRQQLHRQRSELHGEGDRRDERREDAELLRLHGVLVRRAAPDLRARDVRVLPLAKNRSDAHEADRALGAGLHAQTAGVTRLRVDRERLLPAVGEGLDAAHEREPALLLRRQLADLEHVVGADAHAVGLGLAAVAIDLRREAAGLFGAARGFGRVHSRSPAAPRASVAAAGAGGQRGLARAVVSSYFRSSMTDPSLRGRGAASNPHNRFERLAIDFDPDFVQPDPDADPAPAPRTEFFRDPSRSVLSHNDSPDIPFDASINPYRGCEHGCIYCYARPTHEYLGFSAGLDFETKILVKEETPRCCAASSPRRAGRRELVAIGRRHGPLPARRAAPAAHARAASRCSPSSATRARS